MLVARDVRRILLYALLLKDDTTPLSSVPENNSNVKNQQVTFPLASLILLVVLTRPQLGFETFSLVPLTNTNATACSHTRTSGEQQSKGDVMQTSRRRDIGQRGVRRCESCNCHLFVALAVENPS